MVVDVELNVVFVRGGVAEVELLVAGVVMRGLGVVLGVMGELGELVLVLVEVDVLLGDTEGK